MPTTLRSFALFGLACVVWTGVAQAEEAKQTPPLARLSERKLSSDQYQAVVFGKVSLLKDKKPLATGQPLRLNLVKKDTPETAVSFDLKDNEAFILQGIPGRYELKSVFKDGRYYKIEQEFTVASDSPT